MNDLDDRLRTALHRNGAVMPRTMPKGTRARVGAHRSARATALGVGLSAFAIGVVWAIPHGDSEPRRPVAGSTVTTTTGVMSMPPGWPVVVLEDLSEAYIGPDRSFVQGEKYPLMSGTVEGAEFSVVGYSAREESQSVCLQMAGPAVTGVAPPSPGPQIPEESGGVGGFCLDRQVPAVLLEQGWPDFPHGADLVMRLWGQDQIMYMGYATDRVARLGIRLADGTQADVDLLHFPNEWNHAAFGVFPPSSVSGSLEAFDADGELLASAPFCPGERVCMPPTNQVAPPQG